MGKSRSSERSRSLKDLALPLAASLGLHAAGLGVAERLYRSEQRSEHADTSSSDTHEFLGREPNARERLIRELRDELSADIDRILERVDAEDPGLDLTNPDFDPRFFFWLETKERLLHEMERSETAGGSSRSGFLAEADRRTEELAAQFEDALGYVLDDESLHWTGDIVQDFPTLQRALFIGPNRLFYSEGLSETAYDFIAGSFSLQLQTGVVNCQVSRVTPMILARVYAEKDFSLEPLQDLRVLDWDDHIASAVEHDGVVTQLQEMNFTGDTPLEGNMSPDSGVAGTLGTPIVHIPVWLRDNFPLSSDQYRLIYNLEPVQGLYRDGLLPRSAELVNALTPLTELEKQEESERNRETFEDASRYVFWQAAAALQFTPSIGGRNSWNELPMMYEEDNFLRFLHRLRQEFRESPEEFFVQSRMIFWPAFDHRFLFAQNREINAFFDETFYPMSEWEQENGRLISPEKMSQLPEEGFFGYMVHYYFSGKDQGGVTLFQNKVYDGDREDLAYLIFKIPEVLVTPEWLPLLERFWRGANLYIQKHTVSQTEKNLEDFSPIHPSFIPILRHSLEEATIRPLVIEFYRARAKNLFDLREFSSRNELLQKFLAFFPKEVAEEIFEISEEEVLRRNDPHELFLLYYLQYFPQDQRNSDGELLVESFTAKTVTQVLRGYREKMGDVLPVVPFRRRNHDRIRTRMQEIYRGFDADTDRTNVVDFLMELAHQHIFLPQEIITPEDRIYLRGCNVFFETDPRSVAFRFFSLMNDYEQRNLTNEEVAALASTYQLEMFPPDVAQGWLDRYLAPAATEPVH